MNTNIENVYIKSFSIFSIKIFHITLIIVNVVISSDTLVPTFNFDFSIFGLHPTTYRGPLEALIKSYCLIYRVLHFSPQSCSF